MMLKRPEIRSTHREEFERRSVSLRLSLSVMILMSLALASDADTARVSGLTKRVFCNCGCNEVLAECSHIECQNRVPLKREIAAAVRMGESDDLILEGMRAKYGSAILVVPGFQGFNALLWIVPVGGALITVAVFGWVGWSRARRVRKP